MDVEQNSYPFMSVSAQDVTLSSSVPSGQGQSMPQPMHFGATSSGKSKRKRNCTEVEQNLDNYSVFQNSSQEQDQELARNLFNALVAIDPDTARKVAEFHTGMIRRPDNVGEGRSGKWNLFDEGKAVVGYLSLKPNYLGSILLQDEELGNIYCEVQGLIKESFQASNNLKLVVKTDQLGEMNTEFTGALSVHTNDTGWQTIRGYLSLTSTGSMSSTLPNSAGEWEFGGQKC